MQISMAGKYAIRAMMYLASLPTGDIIQISELSGKWEIPEKYLRKIFLNKCLMSPDLCEKSPWCSANLVWHEAQESMKKVLQIKIWKNFRLTMN